MPPRVRDVLALPGLALDLRAGAAGTDRTVRWVAVSEQEDPTPFLEGGELLLTTGMRLAAFDDVAAYVDRLAAAGVAGLGLGLGLGWDDVPEVLVGAADAAGLPLFAVPPPTAFIAVGKAVSDLLAAEEYDEAARGFAAQRDLIRAALTDEEGSAAVVQRLARHLGGWAAQLDRAGGVVHAAPSSAARRAAALAPEVARLRPRGLLASAVLADRDTHVVLQPLGIRGRAQGFLAVGTAGPPGPTAQAVCNLAVSLLSLDLARAEARSGAERAVRAAALRLVLAGRGGELPLAGLGWGPPGGRVRVLVGRVADGQRAGAEDALAEAFPGTPVAAGVLPDDPGLVVVLLGSDDDPAATPVARRGPVVAAGVGDLADLDDEPALARSTNRARGALAAARPGQWRRHEDLGGAGLEALFDGEAADAWAAALLAPLDDPAERADLRDTLRAWLAEHGQVDAAASRLGVHRHTVRHRLRRAESLLGRPLDDAGVRAELWVALSRST